MLYIPENYVPRLAMYDVQRAIDYIKRTFQMNLAIELNLRRVSAPLFVQEDSGLNDNLSGRERPVGFDIPAVGETAQVVQSLAKWKRLALKRYEFYVGKGLYTDMNAIRRDEKLDEIHSIYVDQWDWEKIITKEDRKITYLKKTVREVYKALLKTARAVAKKYPQLKSDLPAHITFVSTTDLEKKYPDKTRKERESIAAKEHGAIFLYRIGWDLKDGRPHDGRAADYDDWKLNGDIILWNEILGSAFEISSMGIRVDDKSLIKQLTKRRESYKMSNPYCMAVIHNQLPLTVGGGIGQSRLCMFLLKKAHIGEVQSSVWTDEINENAVREGINLL